MTPFFRRNRRAASRQLEADVDDELGFHLEMTRRELEAGGAGSSEAAATARRRFGDPARVRMQCLQIADGDRTMIKNILLAASLLVILTLSLMCVHFYGVARAARQDAHMQRALLAEQMQRAELATSFLERLLVVRDARQVQADLSTTRLSRASTLAVGRMFADPRVETSIRAATQAAQHGEEE